MKKISLLIYFCALVSIAFSQNVIKEVNNETTRFIPGAFMKNGVAAIYFSDNEYGYDGADEHRAEIFDFELNPLKTFNIKTLQPYMVIESRTSTGSVTKTKDIEKVVERLSWDSTSIEERKSMFANKLYWVDYNHSFGLYDDIIARTIIDGTTLYVSVPIGENIRYDYSEYLDSVKVFLKADNTFGYLYHCSITVPKYDGEWTTTTTMLNTKSIFYTPRCVDVSNMNHWNGGVYLPFSQTFFNDDEEFEYVSYKSEIAEGGSSGFVDCIEEVGDDPKTVIFGITDTDRDGDGEVDYKTTLYGIHYKGFEVVKEDGTVLYTFDFPGSNVNYETIEFFKSDNYILAQLSFHWQDEEDRYCTTTRFYRIDKTSTDAPALIREESRVSAAPNPASKGTPVIMTLSSDNSNARKVMVTSLSGAQVFSQSVAPGVSQVAVPTDNLASGTYLFIVTESGRKVETCKIVIK